jgi:hypothetical protein
VLCCFLQMVSALREPADSAGPIAVFLDVHKIGLALIDSLLRQDLRRSRPVEVGDTDEEISLILVFESDGNQCWSPWRVGGAVSLSHGGVPQSLAPGLDDG